MNTRVPQRHATWIAALGLTIALGIAPEAMAQSRGSTDGREDRQRTERKEEPKQENAPAARPRSEPLNQERAPERRENPPSRSDARDQGRSSSDSGTRTTPERRDNAGDARSNPSSGNTGRDQARSSSNPATLTPPERRDDRDDRRDDRDDRRDDQDDRRDDRDDRRDDRDDWRDDRRDDRDDDRWESNRRPPVIYGGGRDNTRVYRRDRPHVVVRPNVHVSVQWPWQYRYHRHWEPHYRYRQVVYVQVGWGSHRRVIDIDVRTRYHQRVRHANDRYALVDIYIDAIELYRDGRFMGEVNRIPDELAHIEATIHRDGYVDFDRDVFLVGDPVVGFEMISTLAYDGYVLDHYRDDHGYRVGELNLRRERVYPKRYSRLFHPRDFNGYPPISLLPDRGMIADYGDDAISYRYHRDNDYDGYFGGRYSDPYEYEEGGVRYNSNPYTNGAPHLSLREGNGSTSSTQSLTPAPFSSSSRDSFRTESGADIAIKRDFQLERIQ